MAGPMPPVPGVIQVNIQGTIPGEIWENVLHFAYSGPSPTAGTLTAWAAGFASQWATHISPLQSVGIVQSQVVIIDIASTTGAEGTAVANSPGTRAGADLAANTAALLSYAAPTRYRGGHFRTYLLAGVSQDLASQMAWVGSFVTTYVQAWQAFLNASIGQIAGGNQITQLVGVRRHGKYLPNGGPPNYVLTAPIAYPLTVNTITGHTQVASQKGRIGRRSK